LEISKVETQCSNKAGASELARYFAVAGAHLYTVLHQVSHPVARALLIGPLAAERHETYHPWVRWARYLAARQIEVLRFDYRGMGESTGVFEEMSFENWSEDVQLLRDWLGRQTPRVPILLHGLEIGGIFAANLFDKGYGDALLQWSPPSSANEALRSNLRHWAGLEQLYQSSENRKTASDYIRQIEQGEPIEVDGYQWSARLWRESFQVVPPSLSNADVAFRDEVKRRIGAVKLNKDASPLVRPHLRVDEVRDLTWLYAKTFNWVAEVLALSTGETNEGSS
jgi:hypothetical protein